MDHDGGKLGLHPAANKLPATSNHSHRASRINEQIEASLNFAFDVQSAGEFDGLHSNLELTASNVLEEESLQH